MNVKVNIETKSDARKRRGWSGEDREDDYGEMISAESSVVSGGERRV